VVAVAGAVVLAQRSSRRGTLPRSAA